MTESQEQTLLLCLSVILAGYRAAETGTWGHARTEDLMPIVQADFLALATLAKELTP